MGMYTWLYKLEMEEYSKVSDGELNKMFQDVRNIMHGVFISERTVETKMFFFGKKVETFYNIYHLTGKEISDISEVRCLNLYLYNKELVYNYLCGLYNGYNYLGLKNYPSLN